LVYPRSQPRAKQQHDPQTEQGRVYCDEKIVNGLDPLTSLEKCIQR
jgi:hypothetical protein